MAKTAIVVTVLVTVLGSVASGQGTGGGHPLLGAAEFRPSPQQPVGWRGDGTGVFPGATPPTEWDGPSGKNILWKAVMPHQTLASPIVVGDKVVTLADPHTVLCYSAADGKLLWYNAQDPLDRLCASTAEAKKVRRLWDLYHRHFTTLSIGKVAAKDKSGLDLASERAAAEKELAAGGVQIDLIGDRADTNPFFTKYGLWSDGHAGIGFANATPVSDGKRVWVRHGSNDLACYDLADGKLVWLTFFGPVDKVPNGYAVNSPLLVDGVIVQQGAGHLRGLDADTGKVLWDHPHRDGRYSCGTPVVIATATPSRYSAARRPIPTACRKARAATA